VCAAWALCQAAVIGLYFSAQDEDFIAAGRRSPTIAWVKSHTAPTETILTDRGPDLAHWCPNPVLRLPRPPFSQQAVTSWEEIDGLARKAGARYLVHTIGFPETPVWDGARAFRFLRSLDRPEDFPQRKATVLGDSVVYEVGPSSRRSPSDERSASQR
jgi:hypothetical protein